MAESLLKLVRTRLTAGVWEGRLTGPEGARDTPEIEVTHLGEPVAHELAPLEGKPGQWRLRIPVPAERLSDGVQVFLIADRAGGALLGSFTIVTGEPLEEDIRAEVNLLRAELDMLKQAFRRHFREGG